MDPQQAILFKRNKRKEVSRKRRIGEQLGKTMIDPVVIVDFAFFHFAGSHFAQTEEAGIPEIEEEGDRRRDRVAVKRFLIVRRLISLVAGIIAGAAGEFGANEKGGELVLVAMVLVAWTLATYSHSIALVAGIAAVAF